MPGHDSVDVGIDLRELILNAVGPRLSELVQGAAHVFLPDCYGCAKKSIPLRCKHCGQFACTDHAYINVGRLEVVCLKCVRELTNGQSGDAWDENDPWEVLGIEPGASKEEIGRVFRIKARDCHPDFHPGDEEKAQQWRRLRWAQEQALLTHQQKKG